MGSMTRTRRLAAATAIIVLAGGARAGSADLGSIRFPNSGAPEAQDAFIRAVLLLHSFEYEDARAAFREAQVADPDFALAYWGEAMTYNHPLWREQDRDAALATLAKLGPTAAARLDRAGSARERGYLSAVEVLYGEGDKVVRDLAYSEAMGELAQRYPEDLEARAFYALSILGTAQGIRDFGVYVRAGAVAEEVFAADPRHPGAAHYMIHSYDDPVHAPLGLRAARVYAQIAPAASHAQHMISHIYVALGQWADSVDANVKAFDVSAERRKNKDLGADALNYHALAWLEYSYLQLGRYDEARARLDMMTRYAQESGSAPALGYHAAMRAAWIVETRGREAPPSIRPDDLPVAGAAADLFATGYAALLAGDRASANDAAAAIGSRHATAAAGHLCGQTGSPADTSKNDLIVADVLEGSLKAMIELDRGNTEAALALLDRAAAAEAALPMDFGPPAIVKPSHELYGEVLLGLGRPQEARAQFEKALARAPRRSLALAGLVRAAQAQGDPSATAKACAELSDVYARADPSVPRPAACGTKTAGSVTPPASSDGN
jgi:tetratricopeptide (TPR) repeat protein